MKAQLTVLFQGVADRILQLQRQLGVEGSQGRRGVVENPVKGDRSGRAGEGMLSSRKLIQHHAQRENIAARIQGFAPRLFRGHVSDGADGRSRSGKQLICERLRYRVTRVVAPRAAWDGVSRFELSQPEVENFRLPGGRHKDVARLDVAVDDALSMRRVQRVCHLDPEIQQPGVGD